MIEFHFEGYLTPTTMEDAESFPERVEAVFDTVMDELVELCDDPKAAINICDPIVAGSIVNGTVEITLHIEGVEGLSFAEIYPAVDSTLRSAFHAADVNTPDWGFDLHESDVRIARPDNPTGAGEPQPAN